ncbi:uncharacterized protein PAC_18484 [Phialocephala subalpina]|uniref:Uncharacterized protein n=1 Tax=Phialocephala subalpina TaxID=576137 RepID=A0A1L7XU92_9HELO|nr:uncharacterized protein PAC_18484 [Phialocephala subalpina]
MWLLDAATIELHEFPSSEAPLYAILSHTWGPEEVSFRDLRDDRDNACKKAGFAKIQRCCKKTLEDRLEWVWIDTCCIDKQSSAEVAESINSMYAWYRDATLCYAYLEDIPTGQLVRMVDIMDRSRWFTRGWTLQELIAPTKILFLNGDWDIIGKKYAKYLTNIQGLGNDKQHQLFLRRISDITGIPEDILDQTRELSEVCIATRMTWASQRQTTKEEDRAYCLMGLFDVNIPVIYGEGLEKAFRRLQIEIMNHSPDQTIFAWNYDMVAHERSWRGGLTAPSPQCFAGLRTIERCEIEKRTIRPFSMTNAGLSITLPVRNIENSVLDYEAILECRYVDGFRQQSGYIVIPLSRWNSSKESTLNQFLFDIGRMSWWNITIAQEGFKIFTGEVTEEFQYMDLFIIGEDQSRKVRERRRWLELRRLGLA